MSPFLVRFKRLLKERIGVFLLGVVSASLGINVL